MRLIRNSECVDARLGCDSTTANISCTSQVLLTEERRAKGIEWKRTGGSYSYWKRDQTCRSNTETYALVTITSPSLVPSPCHVRSRLFSCLRVHLLPFPLSSGCTLSHSLNSRCCISRLFRVSMYCFVISSISLFRFLRILLVFVGLVFVRIVVLLGLINDYLVALWAGE